MRRFRDCEIFVLALSPDSVRSTACSREANYAETLGKPILPIMVAEGVGVLPARLSKIHYVDYRKQDRDALADLARALRATPQASALPQPLPEPPAISLSYLERIAEQIDAETPLSSKDQSEIVSELRGGLKELETAFDALALLERLGQRPELLARIGREIEELLGDAAAPRKADPAAATQATSTPASRPTPSQQTLPADLPPPPPASPDVSPALHVRRWLSGAAFLLLWAIISPIAIHGIMSVPSMVLIIPIATLLFAIKWPIRPIHAALFTVAVHMANVTISLAVGAMWEKDLLGGVVIVASMTVVNVILVAIVSALCLRRMQQRR